MGKGVSKAVANINEVIAPTLIGMDVTNQQGPSHFAKSGSG